jgi:putative tryptophan/tyrosine transport system substrate-binding protein
MPVNKIGHRTRRALTESDPFLPFGDQFCCDAQRCPLVGFVLDGQYCMRRRNFIALLGSAAAWPLAARAQQADRMRRIGVLMALAADDPDAQMRIRAFLQALPQLGWTVGRNVQIDTRWATTDTDSLRRHAAELAALAPDVLVAGSGTATIAPLLQATRTVPIVFTVAVDPVGAGFVASLARPGGNATGFTTF